MVERGVIVGRVGEGADGTADDNQEKALQQRDTHKLGTTENDDDDAEDDQEVVEQGIIDKGCYTCELGQTENDDDDSHG
jgi:hypothetical protein